MTDGSSPVFYRRGGCLKIHVSHELYETGKDLVVSWWLPSSLSKLNCQKRKELEGRSSEFSVHLLAVQ